MIAIAIKVIAKRMTSSPNCIITSSQISPINGHFDSPACALALTCCRLPCTWSGWKNEISQTRSWKVKVLIRLKIRKWKWWLGWVESSNLELESESDDQVSVKVMTRIRRGRIMDQVRQWKFSNEVSLKEWKKWKSRGTWTCLLWRQGAPPLLPTPHRRPPLQLRSPLSHPPGRGFDYEQSMDANCDHVSSLPKEWLHNYKVKSSPLRRQALVGSGYELSCNSQF